MSFRVPPRTGNIDPTSVFDEGCAESRIEELTKLIIAKLTEEDLKAFALSYKKKFEAVPLYPLNATEIRDKFYEKARKEAVKILEQERKNCVEERSQYIKNTLNLIIKQLRLIVYTEHGKGKFYVKKEPLKGVLPKDAPLERDVMYFEGDNAAGIERYQQICRVLGRLGEFQDYEPYMNQELLDLWNEASQLGNIEIVWKDKK